MAATITNDVTLTIAFSDATSRNIKFSGVDDDELINVSSHVKQMNRNFPATVATTFVSAIGASSTMISKAVIVSTSKEVIYNG